MGSAIQQRIRVDFCRCDFIVIEKSRRLIAYDEYQNMINNNSKYLITSDNIINNYHIL